MGSTICSGLRVLDLSRSMAGALATMVLADAAAEIIKVEPPEGDPTRRHPAAPMWHRGKKSIVVDLKTAEGRASLHGLARYSDVLLTTFRPGVSERLGVDYGTLGALNPALVHCAITGFGPVKQWEHIKAYEGIVAALTGRAHTFDRQIDREGPFYAAVPVATFGAAMYAVQGILAALYAREKTGRGQRVETSLLQGIGAYDWGWINFQLERRGTRFPSRSGVMPTPGYFVARCKDGRWIQMANVMPHLFRNWFKALGLGEYLDEPRFRQLPMLSDEAALEEAHRLMFTKMESRTLDEWMRLYCGEVDTAAEPFLHTQEAFSHPQVLHNGNVIEIFDEQVGPTRQVGPLARFAETPMAPQAGSPRLGQHTREVLGKPWGKRETPDPSPFERLRAGSPPQGRRRVRPPLEGVLVLEFASFFAAPYGPSILAEFGARVIKVEPPEGDPFRAFSFMAARTTQAKQSLAVDLRQEEGREIVHRLLPKADILVHNFRPGVTQRLGIDYETARSLNPRLIYLYAASYGATGPSSHRPAMHPIAGAIAGGALYQAGRGTPPPPETPLAYEEVRRVARALAIANEGNPDVHSALGVATALLLALYAREKTGKGQYVETSMICSNLYANADDFIQYRDKRPRRLPDPQLYGLHALYRLYAAREGWLFLACVTEEEWRAFCNAVERPELLADARFSTRQARLDYDGELAEALATMFQGRSGAEWQESLTRHDVACVEVYPRSQSDFFNTHPLLAQHGLWIQQQHPAAGSYQRHGPAVAFSEGTPNLGPMASVGEHTEAMLRELGYGSDRIRDLEQRRVIRR